MGDLVAPADRALRPTVDEDDERVTLGPGLQVRSAMPRGADGVLGDRDHRAMLAEQRYVGVIGRRTRGFIGGADWIVGR